jgi:hypothetical protein
VSLVWGIGLVTEAVLRIVAIYVLPIDVAADVSQVLMVVALGGLALWTIRSGHSHTKVMNAKAMSAVLEVRS